MQLPVFIALLLLRKQSVGMISLGYGLASLNINNSLNICCVALTSALAFLADEEICVLTFQLKLGYVLALESKH